MEKSHEAWSADQRELGARLQLSQARLAEQYVGSKGPRTYKVWAACVALTAGYGKVSDVVHARTVEQLAGLTEGKGSKPLRELHDKGVIVWVKQAGLRAPGTLSLPPLPADDDDRQDRQADSSSPQDTQDAPDSTLPARLRNLPADHPAVREHRDMADETERLFGGSPTSDETDKERHGMADRRRR